MGQASIATSSQTEAVNTPMAAHTSANSGTLNPHNNWIIDTGATDHMTNDPMKLTTSRTPKQLSIQTANGDIAPVTNEGSVRVTNSMDLDCVLVVPSLSANLLSVSQITEALNCYVIFWPNRSFMYQVSSHNTFSINFMVFHLTP